MITPACEAPSASNIPGTYTVHGLATFALACAGGFLDRDLPDITWPAQSLALQRDWLKKSM